MVSASKNTQNSVHRPKPRIGTGLPPKIRSACVFIQFKLTRCFKYTPIILTVLPPVCSFLANQLITFFHGFYYKNILVVFPCVELKG